MRGGVVATLVAGLDLGLKAVASGSLERGESERVFFGLELVNVRNSGVAFGFLSGAGTAVAVLTALALALLVGYFATRAATPWLWLPAGMLLGGALGNLIDRVGDGEVTDFIDPYAWPAFNLADTAIVLGLLGLFYVNDREHDVGKPGSTS